MNRYALTWEGDFGQNGEKLMKQLSLLLLILKLLGGSLIPSSSIIHVWGKLWSESKRSGFFWLSLYFSRNSKEIYYLSSTTKNSLRRISSVIATFNSSWRKLRNLTSNLLRWESKDALVNNNNIQVVKALYLILSLKTSMMFYFNLKKT